MARLAFRAESPQFPPINWEGGVAYKETEAIADVSIQAATVTTAQSQVQLSGIVRNLDAPNFDLTVQIPRLAASELQALFPESPLQQDLSGSVQLSGSLYSPVIKAEVQTPDGKAAGVIKANRQHSPPQYDALVDLDRVVLHKVARLPDVQGTISGHIEFTGNDLESGKVNFQLRPTQLRVRERTLGNGEMTGTLVNQRLTATGKVRGPIASLQWDGWVQLSTPLSYEGTLAIRDGNIANLIQQPSSISAAILNADISLAGQGTTPAELVANTRVTLLPSQIGQFTDVHGSAVATLHHQQLILEQLALASNGTTVHLEGQVNDLFSQTPQTTLNYKVQAQDVAPWLQRIGHDGQGTVSLAGTLTGSLQQLTVSGTANGNALRWGKHTLHNGAVTYRLQSVGQANAHGEVTVSGQQLTAGEVWRHVAAEATIVRAEPLEMQTKIQAQSEQIRDLHAQVHLQQQQEQWNVTMRDLIVQLPIGVWTQAHAALLTVQAGQLTLDSFTLQRGTQTIALSGTLAEHGSQDLQVRVSQFSLPDLHTLIPSFPPLEGHLNLNLHVKGTQTQPEAKVQLTTSPLSFRGQSYAGLTGHGTYQNEKFLLHAALQQNATHTLILDGTLPVSINWHDEQPTPQVGDADLRLHSDGINVALLGLVTSDEVEDLEGIARIDLTLRGPLTALRPFGRARLRHGRVRLLTPNILLKDIEAAVAISPDALDLQQFTLSSGQGELTGSGRMALQQSTPGNMALTFVTKGLRIMNTRRYKAALSGQLTCSGSLAAPLVRGTLTLEDTTLRPNIALLKSGPPPHDSTITVVQTDQNGPVASQAEHVSDEFNGTPEVPPTPELLRQLTADVVVRIPRDTWIHMAEGSIEMNGKLTVKKNPREEPRLVGALETVRGWYAFHGRKFTIERGQVTFPDALPIEPNIDVVARYTVAPYEVDVVLGGTAHTPTLDLRSNPALEEADILSVLIFGRPANGLSSSEQASLQTQALQATAGYVASGLRQSIANKLGLDNLEFDMGQSIGQGRVKVGKYLIKDVYVSTAQQLGEKQEREVSVEYQIAPQWQLKGTTTSRGTSGVDVLWRKRY